MRKRFVQIGLAALSFVLLWVTLMLSYAGTPKVEIQIESESFGISQMYFASEENEFTERASTRRPLAIGVNTLRFPFSITRGTAGDFQRWDPSDQPGTFVVSKVSLSSAFLSESVPLDSLRPQIAIGGFVSMPTGIGFTTESNDAQVLLNAPLRSFYFRNTLLLAGIAGLLVGAVLLTFFAWRRRKQIHRSASSIEAPERPASGQSADRFLTLVRVGAVIALFGVITSLAWLSDDALITIRTALNAVNGYGPDFNIDERVQAFTHPLWFGLLWLAGWFTGQWMLVPMLLGIIFSTTAAVLIFWNTSVPSRIIVGGFALMTSNAFVEYSTSGLENSLAYLLIAGLLLSARRLLLRPSIGWSLGMGALAGALILTRLDLALIVLPLLLLVALSLRNHIKELVAIAGPLVLLLAAWLTLSFGYYGTLLPTTFWAKTNVDIPRSELVSAGLNYIAVSLLYDPISLAIVTFGIALAIAMGTTLTRTTLTGVVLYICYVVWIGGDFMAGRFLAVPVFTTVAVLLLEKKGLFVAVLPNEIRTGNSLEPRFVAALGAVALLFTLFLVGQGRSDFLTPSVNDRERWEIDNRGGVTDERGYHMAAKRGLWDYLGNRRSLSRIFDIEPGGPIPDEARDIAALQVSALNWPRGATTREVDVICGGLGERGILSGPSVHLVDPCGLTDPFLASIPFLASNYDWRAGHFAREVPAQYIEAIRMRDPGLLQNGELQNKLEDIWRTILR